MSTKPKPPSVAIMIGIDPVLAEVFADGADITLTASRSAYLGNKFGTPEEWRAHCIAAFAASDAEERPILAEAVSLITTHKGSVTLYVSAEAFGVRSKHGTELHPTIASANAWKQLAGFARKVGAKVEYL